MDLHALAAGYSPRRAFDLAHPLLPQNAVLCGKLIAALWLLTGQVVYQHAEPVPFGGLTPGLASGAAFTQFTLLAQLMAILTILVSPFFRTGCAALAALILSLGLLDQPLFSNNRVFCAAVLLMLALGARGVLARLQVALVYACAAADKLLTSDWRSGWFLRTFSVELCRVGELWSPGWSPGAPLPLTCELSERMAQDAGLALLCSAVVIAWELVLALGYASDARSTAPLAVLFHCMLFGLTGSTFGMFFYAGAACSLLVLRLEQQRAPMNRSWPYFVLALGLAGPWVRPWFALALALLVSALAVRSAQQPRSHVTG